MAERKRRDEEVVTLADKITKVSMSPAERKAALGLAYWMTCSEHEQRWTLEEQKSMAMYVLWATQRLSAINQCVNSELRQPTSEVKDG